MKALLRATKLRRFIIFGAVGGVGTVINTAILWALTGIGWHYLLAAAIATETAIISNFIGNDLITFRGVGRRTHILMRFLRFQAVSMAALVTTLLTLWALTTMLGERLLLVWNLVAILVSFLINFGLNQRFTWKEERPAGSRP